MFSMFPDGWPGAGLLLLRVGAGAVLILEGIAYLVGNKRELGFLGWMALGAVGAVGLLLLIGFLTRYVALGAGVVAAGTGLSWFSRVKEGLPVAPTTAALSAVIAVALICLGPGVWSLDARLFGRREIVIPPSSSKT
jgi:uncharacterized membrane protein YphA (DoxX/SURF4 family)